MKKSFFAIALPLLMAATNAHAQTIPENEKTALKLFFSASTPPKAAPFIPPLPELTLFKAKVTAPNSCKGNVGLSFSNAFTDGTITKIFENFEQILSDLASPEGAIFLASLYVSKSNPSLYQLVTEGIDIGLDDFLSAMGSCEALATSLIDVAGDPLIEMQKQTKLNQLIEKNAQTAIDEDWNNVKVEDLVHGGMDKLAENGVTIFDGNQKGGKNQEALALIEDTIHYGWCIYRGYTEEQCKEYYQGGDGSALIKGISDYEKQIFETVDEMHKLGFMIIGNKYISMCNGCESIEIAPSGVKVYIEKEQEKIKSLIDSLSLIPVADITELQYSTISIKPFIVSDANYFRNLAILETDMEVRELYANGWAYDVAYQRAVLLLDMLEDSLRGLDSTPTIEKAGLTEEIKRGIETIEAQRGILERYVKQNNYIPKMYVRSLLRVGDRVRLGKSVISDLGSDL